VPGQFRIGLDQRPDASVHGRFPARPPIFSKCRRSSFKRSSKWRIGLSCKLQNRAEKAGQSTEIRGSPLAQISPQDRFLAEREGKVGDLGDVLFSAWMYWGLGDEEWLAQRRPCAAARSEWQQMEDHCALCVRVV
jgi:hypothetical protein